MHQTCVYDVLCTILANDFQNLDSRHRLATTIQICPYVLTNKKSVYKKKWNSCVYDSTQANPISEIIDFSIVSHS